jgi:hypothetical protein
VALKWFRTYSYIFFETKGPCCNFSMRTGTVVQFTTSLGGFLVKFQGFIRFWNYFSAGKPMDRVHGRCESAAGSGQRWTASGVDNGHGGASSVCGA